MLNLSCIAIILQNDKYLFKEPCTEGTRRQSHIFRLQTESGSRGCLKRGWDLKACDQQNVCRPTYSGTLIKQINNESGCSNDIIACFPRKKITSVFLSYPGPAYFPIQYRMHLVLCFVFFRDSSHFRNTAITNSGRRVVLEGGVCFYFTSATEKKNSYMY